MCECRRPLDSEPRAQQAVVLDAWVTAPGRGSVPGSGTFGRQIRIKHIHRRSTFMSRAVSRAILQKSF
jgi:hypothetical protein